MEKTHLIAIVAAIIVIVAIAAAAIMLTNGGNDDKKDNGGNTPPATPTTINSPSEYTEARLWVIGNADGNELLDENDVKVIQSIIDAKGTATKYPMADANIDGVIDSKDVDHVRGLINGSQKTINYYNADGAKSTYYYTEKVNAISLHRCVTRSIILVTNADPDRYKLVGSDPHIREAEFNATKDYPDIVDVGAAGNPEIEQIRNLENRYGSVVVNLGNVTTYTNTAGLETTFASDPNVQIVRLETWEGHSTEGILTWGFLFGGVGYKSPAQGGNGLSSWDQALKYVKYVDKYEGVIVDEVAKVKESDKPKVLALYCEGAWPNNSSNKTRGEGSGDMEMSVLCGANNIYQRFGNGSVSYTPEDLAAHARDADYIFSMSGGMFDGDTTLAKRAVDVFVDKANGYITPKTTIYSVSWQLNGAPHPVQAVVFGKIINPDSAPIQKLSVEQCWEEYRGLMGWSDRPEMAYSNLAIWYGPSHTTSSA